MDEILVGDDVGAALAALAERLDPVFLPRPLLKVDRLPRNETGKVTRDALRALGSAATVRRGLS